MSTHDGSRSASSAPATSAWSRPPASPSWAHDVYCIDIDEAKIEGLKRGPDPDLGAGPRRSSSSATASACTSRPTSPTRSSTRGCCSSPSARRRPTRATPTSPPSTRSSTRCRPSDRHALVMKSTVPVRHRREHQARLRASRARRASATSPAPSSSRRARRCKDFLEPDRVVIGDDGDWAGDAVAELYAPLDAPLVRTDIKSAEMVKLASNAFLATKISFINEIANVCEETGADVVEVARGMGLDDRIGPKFLQAGIGFGGSCFPKDVHRAQAARRQLRLPLPAAQRGDRGQRAAEAARDVEAPEAPRARWWARRSRCSGSRSSRTPTTCARRPRSCSPRGCRPRARSVRAYDPVAEDGGAQADPRRRVRRLGARRPSRAPTPSCSSPSGPSSASSTSRAVAEQHARHAAGRRAQLPRPRRRRGRRADLRGRRPPERRRAPPVAEAAV